MYCLFYFNKLYQVGQWLEKLQLAEYREAFANNDIRWGIVFIKYKAFRHVETLFIQGNVFIRPGALLVGAIPPTNSGLGRIKTLPWMNKVSTCRKALLFNTLLLEKILGEIDNDWD